MYILTMNFFPHPCRFRPARLLAALAAACFMTDCARALEVSWSNIREMDGHTTIQLLVLNNNPGTLYSEVRINTLKPLLEGLGLDPARDVTANVNSGAGYVNDGWLAIVGSDGLLLEKDPEAYESDPFGFGNEFALTVRIDNAAYDYGAYRIGVVTNAAGAADTAWEMSAQYHATPVWVPGYALSATGLAVRAAQVEVSGVTNVVRLAAETAGRRQFRVQVASSPGVTNWSDLLVCASTGAVTEVCETNTVPTRFYRIISP
jgi:hypothetical protein